MARRASKRKAIARRGLMLVLSSPSGAGKTTLSRMLLDGRARHRTVDLGDDAAAAARRDRTAAHYHFIDAQALRRRWCATASCWNGPRCSAIATARRASRSSSALPAGRDVLFDIDWQGTQQLREKAPRAIWSACSCCRRRSPNWNAACTRRAQDDDDVIRARMAKAADEMSHWAEYDYVIVNRDLDRAFAEVRAILAAERLKRERQTGLSAFVRGLQAEL